MTPHNLAPLKVDLPKIPHKLFNDTLNLLVDFYKEHLLRDVDSAKLTPPDPWVMLRGFLVAGMQTYASMCLLLADKRPKRLMLQAGVLNRSLFETLATVIALTEDLTARTQVLIREAYKNHALRYEHWAKRFGSDPKWTNYLDTWRKTLTIMADKFRIPPEQVKNPAAIADQWPTPGVMLRGRPKQGRPPFVSGSRHAVLKEIYESHYPDLSAQAHGRMASMGMAMLVDDPSLQWNPGYGESQIIASALVFMACILSEIEASGGFPHHTKLAELWAYLRDLNDEAKELWQLRYQALNTGP